MSRVFFISDLHLGHKRILEFMGDYRQGNTVDEHDQWIVDSWNSVVRKRDTVWVLGDVCFSRRKLPLFKQMRGTKKLVLGNHDQFKISDYLPYFSQIYGLTKYKGCWLSHAPIHASELRGCYNLHGHTHDRHIYSRYTSEGILTFDTTNRRNPNYINVCVEAVGGVPWTLEEFFGETP